MKALERMLCVIVLVGIALFAGYSLLDKWAVDEFGIVRVWAVKRSLFSVKTLYYIGFAISAIIAVYIASKLNSVRMLAAVLGVIAVTPFCIWLYNYLGERYFNIVGKTFFYGATTGCAGWVLFSILSAPIGLIKRFAQESRDREERIDTIKKKNRQIESETLAIVSDAKTRFEQGKYITVAGRSALAIDVQTGEQSWHQFAQSAGFEDPAISDVSVLEVLTKSERAVLCGGTGAGKTELAKRVAAHKLQRGEEVWVGDIKFNRKKSPWNPGVKRYGAGNDYHGIKQMFLDIDAEVVRRGNDMDNIDSYPQITLFFDEINNVLAKDKDLKFDIQKHYKRVLTEYREYKVGIIPLGQTNRAKAIGLDGCYDLMLCFDLIVTIKVKITGERIYIADYHQGQGEEIELAGYDFNDMAYRSFGKGTQGTWGTWGTEGGGNGGTYPPHEPHVPHVPHVPPLRIGMYSVPNSHYKRDPEIMDAVRLGAKSLGEICKKIGLSVCGKNANKVKETLNRYGYEIEIDQDDNQPTLKQTGKWED